ncbi:MAG: rhomboid family intramembrane serine protease [bacterium]
MRYSGYQVQFGPGYITPVTRSLLIANAAAFFLQLVLDYTPYSRYLVHYFALSPLLVVNKFFIWQVVTYMFLHGGLFHFMFNMLALWMFGTEVESRMGERRFLNFYFFCGVGAGVVTCLFPPAWQSFTLGASGAIFGILVAFAKYFPDRIILAFMIFPMRARTFVIFFGMLQVFAMLSASGSNIAYFAHLGGILFGYLFLRYEGNLKSQLRHYRWLREEFKKEQTETDWQRVDEILDKVSREGIHKLTKKERSFLREISKKHRH